MKLFLSFASEDLNIAEQIHLALVNMGHKVFFDRASLPPSGDYNSKIRMAIKDSDLFVFLISSHSVTKAYTLTELKFAQKKWSSPKGVVLPVLVSDTNYEDIPNYLKAVTVLEPAGNIAAEVAEEVDKIAGNKKNIKFVFKFISKYRIHTSISFFILALLTGYLILKSFYPIIPSLKIPYPAKGFSIRQNPEISSVILHSTEGMDSLDNFVQYMHTTNRGYSVHYLIGVDGEIAQLLPEELAAWHIEGDKTDHFNNQDSIGVELIGIGKKGFPPKQIDALDNLLVEIVSRNKIDVKNIVGHRDIPGSTKPDPGEMLDLNSLRDRIATKIKLSGNSS